ncbi:MAG: hypothetical protein ABSG65_00855 [Bryobacteraceae bacterium]|jgi:hypothetical protein
MKTHEEELEALAGDLLARVAEGRYRDVQAALREYCRALRKTVAALPRGDPSLARLETGWRQLAEQTRRGLLAGHAHAAARLARIATRPRIYGDGSPPRRTWQLSA